MLQTASPASLNLINDFVRLVPVETLNVIHPELNTTLLHEVCAAQQFSVFATLMDLGVRTDLQNGRNSTPLIEISKHTSIFEPRFPLWTRLLPATPSGALTARDSDGKDAIDYFVQNSVKEIKLRHSPIGNFMDDFLPNFVACLQMMQRLLCAAPVESISPLVKALNGTGLFSMLVAGGAYELAELFLAAGHRLDFYPTITVRLFRFRSFKSLMH